MVKTIPDILAQIVAAKKSERKQLTSAIQKRAEESVTTRRPLGAALTANPPAIIAEIKKASPSKGVLVNSFDPASIGRSYEEGGAAALSVLTDTGHFQGSLEHLQQAREAVQIPVLRKDFTIDPFDVIEAAAHGADAILLIAAILDTLQLQQYRELAAEYRMAALVEVHDEAELRSATDSGAHIIGVNNRNLHTFEVNLDTALRLAPLISIQTVKVAESGIRSGDDVRRLAAAGYQAFLVGEHLMRSANSAGALLELRS